MARLGGKAGRAGNLVSSHLKYNLYGVLGRAALRFMAARLAEKSKSDVVAEGMTLDDSEMEPGEVNTFIENLIAHVRGTRGI